MNILLPFFSGFTVRYSVCFMAALVALLWGALAYAQESTPHHIRHIYVSITVRPVCQVTFPEIRKRLAGSNAAIEKQVGVNCFQTQAYRITTAPGALSTKAAALGVRAKTHPTTVVIAF